MLDPGPMGDRLGEQGRHGVLPTMMPPVMRPPPPGGGGGGGGVGGDDDEGEEREEREERGSSYRPPAPSIGSCAGHGATLTLI